MVTPEMIARINELGRKQKTGQLTPEECTEQATLRRLYIDTIKDQVKIHFDGQKEHTHCQDSTCGCHHKQ